MRILLIRHGEPDYSRDGLTAAGRREAELLSRRLSKYHFRDIFVSPLGRAAETAEYTLRLMGKTAEVLPWLAEFRGRYHDPETGKDRIPWDFTPRFWLAHPELLDPEAWADAPLFSGGTVRAIWDETKEGVDALMARYGFRKQGGIWLCGENNRDTVALFCHFGISMAVLAYLIDVSPVLLWQRVLCHPASLTEAVTEERVPGEAAFRITRLGDIGHLEAAGVRRSTFGLYPECFTGVDSTDPSINHELPWDL